MITEKEWDMEYSHIGLGIDPGLAATGYAVIGTTARGGALVDWGSFKTSKKFSLPKRLQIIFNNVDELIIKCQPVMIVMEDVYVLDKFPKAAIQLGEVRGVICLAAQNNSIEVIKISPTEVKSCLTGNGRATKVQLNMAVKRVLGVKEEIKPDHASDAAALAVIGLSRKGYYVW